MSKIYLPTEDRTRSKDQPLKERLCGFPGCQEKFMGRGKTKYCEEHRKQEYRSKLYSKPKGESAVKDGDGNFINTSDVNQTIKHSYTEAVETELKCACCGKRYHVTLIPSQFIYPKYCEEHRNEFKRNRYTQLRGLYE